MARGTPFEQHTRRYEAWFERHDAAYVAELLALRPFVPMTGRGACAFVVVQARNDKAAARGDRQG